MITATPYKGHKIGVFGLGKAGEASVAALLAGGAEVYAWDDKLVASSELQVPSSESACHLQLRTCNYQQWPWETLSGLVLAPGIPKTHPCGELAKKHDVPIIGDIEILLRSQPAARTIAITGTNGKSTTTTLIGHIFKEAGKKVEVGGNLGTAALSLAPLGADGVYVLELSSYQLDLVHTTQFNMAVLLNITPDHLDRHGDMAGYIAAKKHIFDRQTTDDVAVIAVDDEHTRGIKDSGLGIGLNVVPVSCRDKIPGGIYVQQGVLYDGDERFDISGIATLTGEHNWQNAAVAYAVARAEGIAPEAIFAAMKSFPGLRHRLQLVKTIRGVRFINDSKATNADAVQHALKPYQNIYWIAGGKAKAGGIEPLALLFGHIARAYLIGEAEKAFAETLDGKVEAIRCGTLENAVKKAAEDAFREGREGAVVLLSPACASFDQFTSFEHRGDVFCELVEGLSHGA